MTFLTLTWSLSYGCVNEALEIEIASRGRNVWLITMWYIEQTDCEVFVYYVRALTEVDINGETLKEKT